MKITGKELFVANKVFAIPQGKILYRRSNSSSLFYADIGEALQSLHNLSGFGNKTTDENKLFMKLFCPPTTQVKNVDHIMSKTINYYYKKHYQTTPLYVKDFVIDKKTGEIFMITKKNNGSESVVYDMSGKEQHISDDQLIKITS
jgi:hypothetical protein